MPTWPYPAKRVAWDEIKANHLSMVMGEERRRYASSRACRLGTTGSLCLGLSLIGCAGEEGLPDSPGPPCTGEATEVVDENEPVYLRGTVGDVFEQIQGERTTSGYWIATGEPVDLTWSITSLVTARRHSTTGIEGGCYSTHELDVDLSLRTSDGIIDEQSVATVDLGYIATAGFLTTPVTVPESHRGEPMWPPDGQSAKGILADVAQPKPDEPTFRTRLWLDGTESPPALGVLDGDNVIGVWLDTYDPWGPPDDFVAGDEFADACVGAEDFRGSEWEYTPFESTEEVMDAVAGVWVRCLDNLAPGPAGIRIQPDGSWSHVVLEDGELVEQRGFEHEGYLWLPDISSSLGQATIGLFPFGRDFAREVNTFDDWATFASTRALVFHTDAPSWPAAVYLPVEMPVRTVTSDYESGERAGAGACEQGEQGIVPGLEESAEFLTGEFVLCKGTLPGDVAILRFEGAEVELSKSDGTVITRSPYEVSDANSPRLTVLVDRRQWMVVVAQQPLKIWIQQSGETSATSPVAVFSAAP